MPPWDLGNQPLWWLGAALDFEKAEARAQEIANKIAEARRKGADGDEDDGETGE